MSDLSGSFFSPPARCFKAVLGDVIFYIHSWNITGQRIFAEQMSANGDELITNCSERFGRITLEGIWVTDESPETLILRLEEMIHNNTPFAFNLRQMIFSECRLAKYTAHENGNEPYMNVKLELISLKQPSNADDDNSENEEGNSSDE